MKPIDAIAHVMPSATPTEIEIAAWQALPRDEQLKALQARLVHPDCSEAVAATMNDVLRRAREAAKTFHE